MSENTEQNNANPGVDPANPQARPDQTTESSSTVDFDAAKQRRETSPFSPGNLDEMADEFLANAGQADDETPASPLEALARENDQLEAEAAQLKDQLLRAAAEMENLRRRTQKDVADAKSFSIASFARDMLSVNDNLRRAIDAVPSDEVSSDNSGLKNLIDGVELTEREMLIALEKNGVKKIEPKGERFDPNFHQAMFEVQNPDMPNNSVFEVVQPGYVIGERVLRPAMVGVAKGGPKWSDIAKAEARESGNDS